MMSSFSCQKPRPLNITIMNNDRQSSYIPGQGYWWGADFEIIDTATGDTVVFPCPDLAVITTEQRIYIDLISMIAGATWGDPEEMHWFVVREYFLDTDSIIANMYEDPNWKSKIPLIQVLIDKIGPGEGVDPGLIAVCCVDTLGNQCRVQTPNVMCESCVSVCGME